MARHPAVETFPVKELLAWYDREKRDLPWRRTRDPYRILVSEVMLQQTQVKTVLEYYEPFLERFPTLEALAAADQEEVLAAWKGLGYYQRARRLHALAKAVVSEFGGALPRRFSELRRLKGIGDYTAAAVASIAFGEAKGVVDGNVLRVMSRFLGIEEPIDDTRVKREIQAAVDRVISPQRPGDFNQALMELGATVCTPQRPGCSACPLREACWAHARGHSTRLPVRKPKGKVERSRRAVGILERDGKILLLKRPSEGLLAGMWEFLNLEVDPGEAEETLLAKAQELSGTNELTRVYAGRVVHRFSHIEWEIDAYYLSALSGGVEESAPEQPAWEWVSREELAERPLPRVMQKVWEQVERRLQEITLQRPSGPLDRGRALREIRSPRA
ncbi:MAG TPA: A/G-specific adenine glycosylase [Limnochordia bacterium]|nr:A/G-specific adenine glycosylase [Limnochordia bacterium]